ncbi:MAG: divergent polysaccharide deacetylase family protein, partial [Helicobacter sp.]|nr:divergent polysaccharide deacetylase family protein [Helicobacter sp.]
MRFILAACVLVVLLFGLYEKAQRGNESAPVATLSTPAPTTLAETATTQSTTTESPAAQDAQQAREILAIEPAPPAPTESALPAVVVIIDDINAPEQLRKIDAIPLAITPAIMPNNATNPQSSELHKNREVYLVHLPLQAHNFVQREHIVLTDSQSAESIAKRIADIVAQFPNVRFLNSHTGSKFTEHADSMRALLLALQKHEILFLDSKTTSKSVAREVAESLGLRILERDVFLDFDKKPQKIAKQLH